MKRWWDTSYYGADEEEMDPVEAERRRIAGAAGGTPPTVDTPELMAARKAALGFGGGQRGIVGAFDTEAPEQQGQGENPMAAGLSAIAAGAGKALGNMGGSKYNMPTGRSTDVEAPRPDYSTPGGTGSGAAGDLPIGADYGAPPPPALGGANPRDVSQLGEIGKASAAGDMYRDPSRYAGMGGMDSGTADLATHDPRAAMPPSYAPPPPAGMKQWPGGGPPGTQPPMGAAPATAPQLPGMTQSYLGAKKKYGETDRVSHKQGKAAQIGFHIAQAMQNYSRAATGQAMQPVEWLGNFKRDRRIAQAETEFAPYQKDYDMANKEAVQGIQFEEAQRQQNISRNQILWDQIKTGVAKGILSPEQVKAADAAGFGKSIPMDIREKVRAQVEGKIYAGAPNETTMAPVTGTDTGKPLEDRRQRGIEAPLPSGKGTYYGTGQEVAGQQSADERARATIEQRDRETAYEGQVAGSKAETETGNKRVELEGQATAFEGEAKAREETQRDSVTRGDEARTRARQLRADGNDSAADAADKQADDFYAAADKAKAESGVATSKAQAARNQAKGLKANVPPAYKGAAPATRGGAPAKRRGSISTSDLQRIVDGENKEGRKVTLEQLRKRYSDQGYTIR
jgi:hypothetical protein